MKFMKRVSASFINFIRNDHKCKILFIMFIIGPFKMGYTHPQNDHYFRKKHPLLTRPLSMTLRLRAKVLLHVCSYDFMTWRYPLNDSDII